MRLMGVPTYEVGYNPAIPRTEDHEVHKRHVVGGKNLCFADYWIAWFMCWKLYSSTAVRQDGKLYK